MSPRGLRVLVVAGLASALLTACGGPGKREASALSDDEVGRPEGAQQTTARTILANHEGSRTWLIIRALGELGIPAEAVIAENEPFSADPAFPGPNAAGPKAGVMSSSFESICGNRIPESWNPRAGVLEIMRN